MLCNIVIHAQFYFVMHTAAVLLADYVTTGDGLKMASTVAYNLSDNHRYSIANFKLQLNINTLQQLNILSHKQTKYCRKLTR